MLRMVPQQAASEAGGSCSMFSQSLISALQIAGCFLVYEVGIRETPAKHADARK